MEGFGYAILFSVIIFFADSFLALYCICKLLQLLEINFFQERGARWSLIFALSIPASYFLSKEIVFADRFYFISLLMLFILSIVLGLWVYAREPKKYRND